MTPLEFRSALEKGLGRAILHLQKNDPAPYKEIILETCLRNICLNRQTEGGRDEFLFDAIQLTGDIAYFENEILKALNNEHLRADTGFLALSEDIQQLIGLTKLFALNGSKVARQALYQSFLVSPEKDYRHGRVQAEAIVEFDGEKGLRFVLEQFAALLQADPDFYADDDFLKLVREKLSNDIVDRVLSELTQMGGSEKAYLDAIKHNLEKRQNRPKSFQPRWDEIPYKTMKTWIAERKNSYTRFGWWGEYASQENLERVANDLRKETDPEILRGLLRVFVRRSWFALYSRFLELSRHENEDVQYFAFRALEQIKHPEVRLRALEVLKSVELAGQGVWLLIQNFLPGDEQALEAAFSLLL